MTTEHIPWAAERAMKAQIYGFSDEQVKKQHSLAESQELDYDTAWPYHERWLELLRTEKKRRESHFEESVDFDVELVISFRTNVNFSKMKRSSRITNEDALEIFLGCGLEDALNTLDDAGEYEITIIDRAIDRL